MNHWMRSIPDFRNAEPIVLEWVASPACRTPARPKTHLNTGVEMMLQKAPKSTTQPSPQVEFEKLPQIDFSRKGSPCAPLPPLAAQIAGLCACMGQSAARPPGSVHPQWIPPKSIDVVNQKP